MRHIHVVGDAESEAKTPGRMAARLARAVERLGMRLTSTLSKLDDIARKLVLLRAHICGKAYEMHYSNDVSRKPHLYTFEDCVDDVKGALIASLSKSNELAYEVMSQIDDREREKLEEVLKEYREGIEKLEEAVSLLAQLSRGEVNDQLLKRIATLVQEIERG